MFIMVFIGAKCSKMQHFINFGLKIASMKRSIFFVLAAMVILCGCSSRAPIQNSTVTNITNQTNATTCSGQVCGADGTTYLSDCDALAANATIAHEGVCIPIVCTENPGSITIGNLTLADSCLDADDIIEYSCVNNTAANTTVPCGDGSVCESGECIQQNQSVNVSSQGCSGPSSPDFHNRATVIYDGTNYTDTCVDYTVVKDYFCNGAKLGSQDDECDPGYGCTDGACEKKMPVCSATVAENDTTKQGRTTVVLGISIVYDQSDACSDVNTLTKYYCLSNGTATSEDIPCGNGLKCFEGKCVPSLCNDSDGGINIYEGGNVTANGITKTDYCSDNHIIIEYYCNGDEIASESVSCGAGYFCDTDGDYCMKGSLPS